MALVFRLPNYLTAFAGGHTTVTLAATPHNVQDALELLWSAHPALRDRIVDEQGEVRQHINLFVGNECTRFTGGLQTPVPSDAEILIVPAVSGGR
jgi:molybdopterin synthase sulfur carrier subunit